MRYLEFAVEPFQRSGTMIPLSAYNDILKLPDPGYCSVYQFTQTDAFAIRAGGRSKDFGRLSVYADRLWMDFDGKDLTDESVAEAKSRTQAAAKILKNLGASFTVWFSGGKGFHICTKIQPMDGIGVPYSQSQYVTALGVVCDMSLYQHGRLLSNPGRLHKKTGKRKELIHTHTGDTLLQIPYSEPLVTTLPNLGNMSSSDKAKLSVLRMLSILNNPPETGMRHTRMWSWAMSAFESGLSEDWIWQNLLLINSLLPDPKSIEDVRACMSRAKSQSR